MLPTCSHKQNLGNKMVYEQYHFAVLEHVVIDIMIM